jgi:acyl-CoA synthetase (AMP-forming)/AMP-acid ligase II
MMKTQLNITQLFFESAKIYPDKPAIIENELTVTFSELAKQVHDTAAYFQKKGIQKGDRVLVFVPMSIDLYRIVLALFHMGAVAVFVDEWVNKKRMDECCKVANCKAFIGTFKARLLVLFSTELKKIQIRSGTHYSKTSTPLKIEATYENDEALITFTTGSTGIPKAARRTHGFLQEQFKALIETINPQPDDVDMPVLPIVLLMNLGVGCTSVIARLKAGKPQAMDPGKVMDQLIRFRVTRMIASPFFVKKIARYALKEKITIPSLKKIVTGGAPVFPAEAAIYAAAFPESSVDIVYGSTEAEPISSIPAKELISIKEAGLVKGLRVGKLYGNAQVKIIEIKDEPLTCNTTQEFDKLELAAGKIGEIIVAGPHVLKEYLNNETALKRNKIFMDTTCWHRTGDSGYLEGGELYLTGRCATLIVKPTKIITPFMYENYFQSIQGVEMGTILHIHTKIIAVLETATSADQEMIRAKLNQEHDLFDEICFIKKMPRDPRHFSKIDYVVLSKQISIG